MSLNEWVLSNKQRPISPKLILMYVHMQETTVCCLTKILFDADIKKTFSSMIVNCFEKKNLRKKYVVKTRKSIQVATIIL